jgi:3-hexulose-6-phosphate synthase/6-phospho-3-hexuloisomerase
MLSIYTTPILQVALDCEHLVEAKQLGEMLEQELSGLEYLCEAGTPLIKNEGLKNVIPVLRSVGGKKSKVVADLKTLDTGAFEVELAYKAGAEIVGISGAAECETIDAALSKAEEYKIAIMIDSISIENIKGRFNWIVEKIENYNRKGGLAIFEYHIPIDTQRKARNFSRIREICTRSSIPIAVAGGLDEKSIPKVIDYGAKICIVGGTITRPINRSKREAIRKIKEVIYNYEL